MVNLYPITHHKKLHKTVLKHCKRKWFYYHFMTRWKTFNLYPASRRKTLHKTVLKHWKRMWFYYHFMTWWYNLIFIVRHCYINHSNESFETEILLSSFYELHPLHTLPDLSKLRVFQALSLLNENTRTKKEILPLESREFIRVVRVLPLLP